MKAAKRPRPLKHGTAWWVEHDGEVALVRRPPRGLLGGMIALPASGWTLQAGIELPFEGPWQLLPQSVRHGFTHFELDLRVARLDAVERPSMLGGHDIIWTAREAVADAGLPTLFARAAALALVSPPLSSARIPETA